MFSNPQRYRTLIHFNPPKIFPLSPLRFPFSLKLKFCTSTSDSESDSDSESRSFTVSYLINNVGFSQEAALKVSKRFLLQNSQKPESVIAFFREHGFSDSNITQILKKEPWLMRCDPYKWILPKFVFFHSKGASSSDIVSMLTANPRILQRSLKNRIIPLYETLSRFLQSDKNTLACIIRHSITLSYNITLDNVKLMVEFGVCDSSIARLILTRPSVLCTPKPDFLSVLKEVKGMGFNPSKSTFGVAVLAKKTISKTLWDEKVYIFKKWGWSEKTVLEVFKKMPSIMLVSIDKINLVMSFWVNQMGRNSLDLVKGPHMFSYNLQKRIIPRASVMQFLLKKGLRDEKYSIIWPFNVPERLFLSKFVLCFDKESSFLLKLYEGKMNLTNMEGITGLPLAKHATSTSPSLHTSEKVCKWKDI